MARTVTGPAAALPPSAEEGHFVDSAFADNYNTGMKSESLHVFSETLSDSCVERRSPSCGRADTREMSELQELYSLKSQKTGWISGPPQGPYGRANSTFRRLVPRVPNALIHDDLSNLEYDCRSCWTLREGCHTQPLKVPFPWLWYR